MPAKKKGRKRKLQKKAKASKPKGQKPAEGPEIQEPEGPPEGQEPEEGKSGKGKPKDKTSQAPKGKKSKKPKDKKADQLEFELNLEKLARGLQKRSPTKILATVVLLLLIATGILYLRSPSEPEQPGSMPQMPEEPEVVLTVINDATCAICTSGVVEETLSQVFSNFRIERVDSNSAKGKLLIEELHLATVPAYILSPSVKQSTMYPVVASQTVEINGKQVLRLLGNKLITHKEIPNKIDLYVMGIEQYAIQQQEILFSLLEEFPEADLIIYYIASEKDGKLVSHLGEGDLHEDMRRLCINKLYPDSYLGYILCRGEDIEASWTSCLSGLPQSEIESCASSDGDSLLRENVQMGRDLGVGASPTIIINNQIIMLGLQDEATIRIYICDSNPDLPACQG